jgi:lysozyme
VLQGIDISNWQGTVDFKKVAGAGVSFVFIKATEGTTFVDRFVRQNFDGCKGAGMVAGLYHYFSANRDPVQQAEHFLSVASDLKVGAADLPPVLDLEEAPKDPADRERLKGNVNAWLDAVRQAMGKRPLVYVSPNFWNTYMDGFDTVGSNLWIAHWGVKAPSIPSGWRDWKFWQYSSTGTVPGISGNVDLDHFNGTQVDLRDFIERTGVAPGENDI